MTTRGNGLRLTGAAVAATVALAACSSSSHSGNGSSTTGGASGGGRTINIGVVGTASGPQASSSGQYMTGGPARAGWVTATGGINGGQVKGFTADDKRSPASDQSQVA